MTNIVKKRLPRHGETEPCEWITGCPERHINGEHYKACELCGDYGCSDCSMRKYDYESCEKCDMLIEHDQHCCCHCSDCVDYAKSEDADRYYHGIRQ